MINYIIKNNNIKITPKYIFKFIIMLAVVTFIGGFTLGYITASNIIYDGLYDLIENNRILLFNDKFYTIKEIILN